MHSQFLNIYSKNSIRTTATRRHNPIFVLEFMRRAGALESHAERGTERAIPDPAHQRIRSSPDERLTLMMLGLSVACLKSLRWAGRPTESASDCTACSKEQSPKKEGEENPHPRIRNSAGVGLEVEPNPDLELTVDIGTGSRKLQRFQTTLSGCSRDVVCDRAIGAG